MTLSHRNVTRRLALVVPCLLAACASDLPEAAPPPDAVPSPGLYAIPAGTPVDGTVRLVLQRGSGTARGTLETNGQSFRFTIAGLAVQDGAPSRATVSGRVFGLQRITDFAGTYRDVGGVASDLGAALRLGNDNLVVIELRSVPAGLALGVPTAGAVVALAR